MPREVTSLHSKDLPLTLGHVVDPNTLVVTALLNDPLVTAVVAALELASSIYAQKM